MKIGIIKLGANITWLKISKSAGNFDIHSMCRVLNPFSHLHIITHKTRNTKIPNGGKFHEIIDLDINSLGLDALLVFNGNVNFFGGAESPEGIWNYIHINKFDGPVVVINTDGQLCLKQLWPAIKAKSWATNWKEEDIVVSRKDICYITQGRDLQKTYDHYLAQRGSVYFLPENMYHFPIEKAVLYRKFRVVDRPVKYQLIYGGSPRGGQRKKDLIKFYVNSDLNTLLFGGITPKYIGIEGPKIHYGTRIPNHQFASKMTEGKATCVIGDDFYRNNFFTLRMYESILAGVLTFIDDRMDMEKLFYRGQGLDLMYVGSGAELAEKVQSFSYGNPYLDIVRAQRELVVKFNAEEYRTDLYTIMKKII